MITSQYLIWIHSAPIIGLRLSYWQQDSAASTVTSVVLDSALTFLSASDRILAVDDPSVALPFENVDVGLVSHN